MTVLTRLHLALSFKDLLLAVCVVVLAAVVLGGSQIFIGPHTTLSGFLTILFLLSVVRARSWRARLLSVAWSVFVALLGFAIGGLGLWATLIALAVVSLLQAFANVGESALLTRSPVNLLAFASLSQSGGEVWQVLLGSVIGAAVVLALAAVVRAREAVPVGEVDLSHRIGFGIATAVGSVLIAVGCEVTGFPHVGWMLLSFSIILSVGAERRASRGFSRVVGSVLGVLAAMVLTLLPAPVPTVAALLCIVLCIAYVNAGNQVMFVLLLTPAVLLTTASEHSALVLGALRLEAVLLATVMALVCSAITEWVLARVGLRRSGVG